MAYGSDTFVIVRKIICRYARHETMFFVSKANFDGFFFFSTFK